MLVVYTGDTDIIWWRNYLMVDGYITQFFTISALK